MTDSFKRRVREAFSAAAPYYDAHAQIQGHIQQQVLGMAAEVFGADDRILDLGCGTGMMAAQAAASGLGWQVTQSDFAAGMCTRAAARNPDALTVSADALALPFADAAFDGVFSCLMLQWVEDTARAFAEALRVTAPGGHLVAASFGPGSLTELKQSFAAAGREGHGKVLPDAQMLRQSLERAGWRVDSLETVTVTETYPEVWDLITHLKRIGANQQENAAPVSKEQLNAMAAHYHRHFSDANGIRCSWEVVIMLSTKP